MAGGKLPTSILVALGLGGAGCNNGDDTGPCLDVPVDTSDTDTDTDESGPCLDYELREEVDAPGALPPTEGQPPGERGKAKEAVLDRGVLPDDVAELLRKR